MSSHLSMHTVLLLSSNSVVYEVQLCTVGIYQHSGSFSTFTGGGAALLGTTAISSRFCFTTIRWGATLLDLAGYTLRFATHDF